MKFIILLGFLFMFLANPITGGKLFPGFNNPEKWMKRVIRKLQRKSSSYGQKIASNTDDISNNAGFISSMVDCDSGYINDPAYGLRCCFEDTNNVGLCLCDGTNGTIDDVTNPGSCCFANVEHPDNCICSGRDTDDHSNPGNCCFEDANNLGHCLCNAANYTDDPNKRCFNLDWKADGICDDQNNHGGCDFDGGDCCGKDVDTDLCTLCQCLEEEAPVTNAVGCCFEDSNKPGQCICTGTDIDDTDNAGSCCVEDPDILGTCCVDSITCNGQGTCSSGNGGICSCDSGFTGDRCSITTCPGANGKICSDNGNCLQGPPLVCQCQTGFYGDDCATFCDTTTTCSDQGTCGIDGICHCDAGLKGADCTESVGLLIFACGETILDGSCSSNCGRRPDVFVINADDDTASCANLPNAPESKDGCGGVVDTVPIITSGSWDKRIDKFDKSANQWIESFAELNEGRVSPACAPDALKGALWITGGRGQGYVSLKTTELVYPNGTVTPGPTMPNTVWDHSTVALHDGRFMIIGGVINNNIGRKTNFYDPDTDTFNDGPDMNTDRYSFGAVLLNPCPLFNGRPAVLSVGGHSQNSAELLDYTTNGATWQYIAGVPQTYIPHFPQIGIASIGSTAFVQFWAHIYKLTCNDSECAWEILNQKLGGTVNPTGRGATIGMALPPGYSCN